ncbi:MAG TPA: aspartate carbamoyltransferase catalytic subunit [Candidatus Aminicenantes bacterium]|nr:aspartate carbamoyltransferase catalytic subunit [Candidatus Aminicenantes bacterium]
MSTRTFKQNHLLGIEPLSVEEIDTILDTAEAFIEVSTRDVKKVPALKGKTVVNLFFENSTRTRSSFEIAAKRLSADLINFNASVSSTKKGESLKDTVLTLEAMNPHVIVIRHSASGAPRYLTTFARSAIVNAGDGFHAHPTQALLDALTMRQRFGTLRGLKIAIVGDILHSRVARSNLALHSKMGNEVVLVGPPSLVPQEFERMGGKVCWDLRRGVAGADVVMMLRVQEERGARNYFPSTREYRNRFAITPEVFSLAKEGAILMHPGPINRDVEIDTFLADSDQSVILQQVTNGIAVRMAVLYLLKGEKNEALD